jgi:hypothetical protein
MANRWSRAAFVLISLSAGFQAAAEQQAMAEGEGAATAGAVAQTPLVTAVWKVREVDFMYRSSIAVYSCGALRDRVASILRAVGARDDIDVRASDCSNSVIPTETISNTTTDPMNPANPMNPWGTSQNSRWTGRPTGPEQMTHVRIRVLMPTEVTPEILAELERDQSRRELISRVTGNPAAKDDHPVVFQAQRQPITLSKKTIGLDPVECELLDQISTDLFRRLDVKVVRKSTMCSRNSISRIAPQVTVDSLVGVPVGGDVRLPHIDEADPESTPSEAPSAEPASEPRG